MPFHSMFRASGFPAAHASTRAGRPAPGSRQRTGVGSSNRKALLPCRSRWRLQSPGSACPCNRPRRPGGTACPATQRGKVVPRRGRWSRRTPRPSRRRGPPAACQLSGSRRSGWHGGRPPRCCPYAAGIGDHGHVVCKAVHGLFDGGFVVEGTGAHLEPCSVQCALKGPCDGVCRGGGEVLPCAAGLPRAASSRLFRAALSSKGVGSMS